MNVLLPIVNHRMVVWVQVLSSRKDADYCLFHEEPYYFLCEINQISSSFEQVPCLFLKKASPEQLGVPLEVHWSGAVDSKSGSYLWEIGSSFFSSLDSEKEKIISFTKK